MKTLCVGEVLWDIIGGQAFLGGAPLNAAAHLARLGAESWLLSAVGNDELGRKAIETMAKAGVRPDYVAVLDGFDTGTALVFPEQEGSGRFLLPENTAYDQTALPKEWADAPAEEASPAGKTPPAGKVPAFDALVFGTLASFRSESVKRAVCALAGAQTLACRLYDVNLRLSYYDRPLVEMLLSLCTVFKVNDEEAAVLGELLFGKSLSFPLFAAEILAAFPACGAVLVTKGGQGAEAFAREGGVCSIPGENIAVADTVGAGDAFSAAFLAVWMKTGDMGRALRAGNAAGAFTASKAGAFPAYDDAFVREKIWRV